MVWWLGLCHGDDSFTESLVQILLLIHINPASFTSTIVIWLVMWML